MAHSHLARSLRNDRRLFRYRHGAAYPQFRYLVESAFGQGWRLEWVGELPEAFRRHSKRLRAVRGQRMRGRVILIDGFGRELRARVVWEETR